jgi:hypothetical protein
MALVLQGNQGALQMFAGLTPSSMVIISAPSTITVTVANNLFSFDEPAQPSCHCRPPANA